ncbi:unnamed protein product [Phytomonas sp. Hart1]|nr:unnamed protein product [Phytomonas sp. Hart1]|eukprot:CCW69470.1 unnamed protein product [Phytomonas sp. isolate Hart1]
MLYSIYIYNRYGDIIFFKEWNRTRSQKDGEAGLVAGFIYTLQHISSQLSKTGNGGLRAVETPLYKLHYYETLTGYRLALLTKKEVNTALVQSVLAELFREVFSNLVTRNPFYRHEQGCLITGPEFEENLDGLFRKNKLL